MANAAISAQKIRMRRSFSIRLLPLPIFEIETIVGSKLKSRDIKRHIFGAHSSERADRAAFEGRPEALDRVGVNGVREAGNDGTGLRPPMPTVQGGGSSPSRRRGGDGLRGLSKQDRAFLRRADTALAGIDLRRPL